MKPLLEEVLRIPIRAIRLIEPQKSEKEGYESRGIRLDLFAEDEADTIYSVDVQTSDKKNLPRRMRYYQSVMDIHVLHPGVNYKDLRKAYVIFLCNYDPFRLDRCVYSFENVCREDGNTRFEDGTYKVVVNVTGNTDQISGGLAEVIRYLDNGTVSGDYSRSLDEAVKAVKANEERRLEYMTMAVHDMEIREEGREEGRKEGREEGREEGQNKLATLLAYLKDSGRMDDLFRALDDPEFREKLYEEFNLA